ncbi:DUF397 domain-containing protein [Nocardia cyriacigeorgica]|uniref:DUF397 domain-containing protein n=1 Tax=Nocardia cyriacigeorgica TaxID=135487 RepID=UPI002457A4C5|nr:DUF397 domain-containing protein [Nocardia cyriacigeorgica]
MNVDLAGARWFKSRHSESNAQCVEVAHLDEGLVGVRDSKNPTGPALVFAPAEWDAFTTSLRHAEFDRG